MRKPAFCICENKDADELRGNREANQRLCFHYADSTIPLLPTSEISSLKPSSVAVHTGLCRTWSETRRQVYSQRSSYPNFKPVAIKAIDLCYLQLRRYFFLRGDQIIITYLAIIRMTTFTVLQCRIVQPLIIQRSFLDYIHWVLMLFLL